MSKKLVVAIAVFGLLTSACELRADFKLQLNADESGTVLVTFGLDEEFQALIESGGGESIEDDIFGTDNPFGELPGAETRTYEDGDFTFYEASVPFSDLNGLRLLGTDAENFLNDFAINIDEKTARVTGDIDLGELTGGDLADDQLAGVDAEALAEIFKFHIQIELPGNVSEHNADRVLGDGTLEWDIPLTGELQSLSIVAESSLTGSGGFPTWLIVVIVLAVLAALAFFVLRSRAARPTSLPPQGTMATAQEGTAPSATPPVAENAPTVTEVDAPTVDRDPPVE